MRIKYQEKGYGVMSGESLLRQIQNESTPAIDLLIRESIQNSLDAAKKDSESVLVELMAGTFESGSLSPYLDGINEQLNSSFPGKQEYISVADSGTQGLTGPVSLAHVEGVDYGNLQKLIYQTAKSQTNQGAGGSWGIGKTVYFRVGIGLVIYYSRILNEQTDRYEERMAAMAVENEKKPVLLSENPHKSGIAWWGQKDPDMEDRDGTIPLIDSPEIHQILEVFSLRPMSGNETGTMIIIPYVDSEKLLNQTKTESQRDESVPVPFWKTNLPDCLRITIEKWYCPRLDNPEYRKITGAPILRAVVNDAPILKKDFLPFFAVIQDLYNSSPDNKGSYKGVEFESLKIVSRALDSRFDATAGILSFVRLNRRQLDMTPPENLPSPYEDIDRDNPGDFNDPILAYLRKPGMVVSYETDSNWTKGMPKTEKDEFIIAVFRSSQKAVLSAPNQTDELKTLEDYLRKSENADHLSWQDISVNSHQIRIVHNAMKSIQRKISSAYQENEKSEKKTRNLSLGKQLGSLLLPPEGSEYWDQAHKGSSGPGGTGGEGPLPVSPSVIGGGKSKNRFEMVITDSPEYEGNEVKIPLELRFGKERSADLNVLLQTETGKKTADYWVKQMKTEFPVQIRSLEILNVTHGGKKTPKTKLKFRLGHPERLTRSGVYEDVKFDFLSARGYRRFSSVRITVPESDSYCIELIICLSMEDFEGVLEFKKASDHSGKGVLK